MNAKELKRLRCRFETHKGGSGHLTVWRGNRRTVMPMHGSRKELGAGLVNKILKDWRSSDDLPRRAHSR